MAVDTTKRQQQLCRRPSGASNCRPRGLTGSVATNERSCLCGAVVFTKALVDPSQSGSSLEAFLVVM